MKSSHLSGGHGDSRSGKPGNGPWGGRLSWPCGGRGDGDLTLPRGDRFASARSRLRAPRGPLQRRGDGRLDPLAPEVRREDSSIGTDEEGRGDGGGPVRGGDWGVGPDG